MAQASNTFLRNIQTTQISQVNYTLNPKNT
jgi:hypothetical protein